VGINDTIVLNIGDILYDTMSRDVGLLLRRTNNVSYEDCSDSYELWVWEVYWIREHGTHYTESGLVNMIRSGHLIVHARI
jgi:hypothetical protein